jgi:methionyl aminopeptidase
MIFLKTREEIEIMRAAAQLVSKTLAMLAPMVKPGVTPIHLDKLAEEFVRDHGAIPVFKGYKGGRGVPDFPATLCFSINEAVVHGIPGNIPLKNGDIASIDCGVKLNGYVGDHAYTFAVGEISPTAQKLIDVTKESLYKGIEQMITGNRIGDISHAIQQHAEKHGYGVVRELIGHGLGKNLHEEPEVPNYGKKTDGPKLKEGMVIAIEPMINMGRKEIKHLKDGWTIITADGLPSAHFEHDVAFIDGKADILSNYQIIEEAIQLAKH